MGINPKKGVLGYVFRAPVYLYRWHLGGLLGHRFLLLSHTGRRSGLRRQTVLEVIRYLPTIPEAVVMSGFGRKSDWLQNIEANEDEEISIASMHFKASHRFLSESEAESALRDYENRNRLMAPVVRRVLSALLGWEYTGSSDDRRRLIAQLPLVAFRPTDARQFSSPDRRRYEGQSRIVHDKEGRSNRLHLRQQPWQRNAMQRPVPLTRTTGQVITCNALA